MPLIPCGRPLTLRHRMVVAIQTVASLSPQKLTLLSLRTTVCDGICVPCECLCLEPLAFPLCPACSVVLETRTGLPAFGRAQGGVSKHCWRQLIAGARRATR
jgi:hypothetical protein